MSRIEELISRLCPEGVEYKSIDEVCSKAGNIKWQSQVGNKFKYLDLTSVGRKTGKISEVQIINSTNAPSRAQQIIKENDVIFGTTRPTLERYAIVPPQYDNQICSTGFCVLRAQSSIIVPRFLYYLLTTSEFNHYVETHQEGTSYPAISNSKVKEFQIPIPPLEIQNEIVSILDKFTLLEAELEAELEARKKQYEHYRNALLSFEGKDVEWKTLDLISTNNDSKRKPVKSSLREDGIYPYYGASGIVDYVDDYIFDGDFLLVSEDGANLLARNTPIAFSISGKTWVNNHAHVLKFEKYTTRRLVEIYLNSIDLTKFISGAAQPKLNKENLNKIPIPIPPFDEQERIVSILDKFDALVNDISIGLPAEIIARRKQYEYYRNRLLSFKKRKDG